MDITQVKDLIEHICMIFSKTAPNERKLEFYYGELCDLTVTADAIIYIKKRFSSMDSAPGNLAKAIKAVFWDWQQTQPDYTTKTPCNTCNGYGLLIREGRDPDDGQLYAHTARCPHCENWRAHTGEGTPVAQLDMYNYKAGGSMGFNRQWSAQNA